jgi:hypothetical protein
MNGKIAFTHQIHINYKIDATASEIAFRRQFNCNQILYKLFNNSSILVIFEMSFVLLL